jgi:hypothetical protein
MAAELGIINLARGFSTFSTALGGISHISMGLSRRRLMTQLCLQSPAGTISYHHCCSGIAIIQAHFLNRVWPVPPAVVFWRPCGASCDASPGPKIWPIGAPSPVQRRRLAVRWARHGFRSRKRAGDWSRTGNATCDARGTDGQATSSHLWP